MKGVSLLSDIFLLLALISVTIIMTMFLWYLIIIYEFVLTPTGVSTPKEITIRLLSSPAGYFSTMMSLLELNYNGVPIKKIVNAVAIQGKTDIWLDGQNIDASNIKDILTPLINKEYLLKISPQEIYIAQNGDFETYNTPLSLQKVSTQLFLLDGEAVELQLLVRN